MASENAGVVHLSGKSAGKRKFETILSRERGGVKRGLMRLRNVRLIVAALDAWDLLFLVVTDALLEINKMTKSLNSGPHRRPRRKS